MENDNIKKPNPKIRLILSVICGCLIGLFSLLLGESLCLLVASVAVALLLAIISYSLSIKTGLQKLIAVIVFFVGFLIYGEIFGEAAYGNSNLIFFIILILPYVVWTYILTGPNEK